jgi:branched-chain amino acid transport system ATP-binding protein
MNRAALPIEVLAPPLLSIRGMTKRFGGLVALDAVDLDVVHGEVHALLGPNGAGKTTLLAQLTGEAKPDLGRILFEGNDITGLPAYRRALLGIGRSFQITSVFGELTVLENVCLALQAHAGHSFRFWRRALGERGLVEPARQLLTRVRLSGQADVLAMHLSHGEHRQLEIGLALAGEPKLLLLDEPMAGMGNEDTRRLVELLSGMKGTVAMLLVEHDMNAVFSLADRISVLVYGQRIATGMPDEIRANPEVCRAYLGDETRVLNE